MAKRFLAFALMRTRSRLGPTLRLGDVEPFDNVLSCIGIGRPKVAWTGGEATQSVLGPWTPVGRGEARDLGVVVLFVRNGRQYWTIARSLSNAWAWLGCRQLRRVMVPSPVIWGRSRRRRRRCSRPCQPKQTNVSGRRELVGNGPSRGCRQRCAGVKRGIRSFAAKSEMHHSSGSKQGTIRLKMLAQTAQAKSSQQPAYTIPVERCPVARRSKSLAVQLFGDFLGRPTRASHRGHSIEQFGELPQLLEPQHPSNDLRADWCKPPIQ